MLGITENLRKEESTRNRRDLETRIHGEIKWIGNKHNHLRKWLLFRGTETNIVLNLFPHTLFLPNLSPSSWCGWLQPWFLPVLSLPSPVSYNRLLTPLPRCQLAVLASKMIAALIFHIFDKTSHLGLNRNIVFLLPSLLNAILKILLVSIPYEATSFLLPPQLGLPDPHLQ